ncbi:hypothetical protein BCR43DRAFT_477660 [Syncephalastrum racemosum]|uniref:Carrier domain-containing protein n=1 Tax=Syncephalastrum racemosum TaxID=13706 RepID=A0A1X2H6R1_SYNRA|nr:hypothetical protein BCR43DRAFT_477660 [Syncephalastrum racemosum]
MALEMMPPSYEQLPYQYSKEYAFIHLFEKFVERSRDDPFIHYPTPNGFKTLTYGNVDHVATLLACQWAQHTQGVDTIGFLADTSVVYLVSMLAFLKLRVTFMSLSPRNSQPALVNLMQKTETKRLFASAKYREIARSTAEEVGDCSCVTLPSIDIDHLLNEPRHPEANSLLNRHFDSSDIEKIALIIHTSGSTNFPKPIRLSNRYVIINMQSVTFQAGYMCPDVFPTSTDVYLTSLPLFHMFGINAVTSQAAVGGSIILLERLPPQPAEVLSLCRSHKVSLMALPPVILSQLKAHLEATHDYEPLQKIKLIMFGGAATPKVVGDFYQQHGINVRNSIGATEVNAFANADPDRKNKHWFSLIPKKMMEPYLRWELMDETAGVYHLVVRGDCPSLATGAANLPNGDIATHDLFRRDAEAGPNAWIHIGRQDDVLVMKNGEKTDPIPMEGAIGDVPIVKQCVVVAEGRPCTALLVELEYEQASRYTNQEIIDAVQSGVRKANADAPSHSTILPEMVYILPRDKHLVTTAKNTVIRKRCIEAFSDEIEAMYESFIQGKTSSTLVISSASTTLSSSTVASNSWNTKQIEDFLLSVSAEVLGKDQSKLDTRTSLFDYGLNSLLAIQLRNRIQSAYTDVDMNMVFEYPTIANLADALWQLHQGQAEDKTARVEARYKETQALKERYLSKAAQDFSVCKGTRTRWSWMQAVIPWLCDTTKVVEEEQHVILLTGATGSLGAFLLRDMLLSPHVKRVVALVRGKPGQLFQRLVDAFICREFDASLLKGPKLQVLPMDLGAPFLGWDAATYERLKQEVTLVQACGWLLDFHQPVSHYDKECIQGMYNLLQFAHREVNPMYVHTISSVSCVAGNGKTEIPETIVEDDPHAAMSLGYAQSKYIVEHLFAYLAREKNMPCIVERMGQVYGDTHHGIWNINEQYPLLIVGGGNIMQKMPRLKRDVDWLPVDYASTAIREIMLGTYKKRKAGEQLVYHIVNPQRVPWTHLLDCMKTCGMQFETVTPATWVDALAQNKDNPAYKLLGYFQEHVTDDSKMPLFKTDKAVCESPALATAPLFDTGLLAKQLAYWQKIGFYEPSSR